MEEEVDRIEYKVLEMQHCTNMEYKLWAYRVTFVRTD